MKLRFLGLGAATALGLLALAPSALANGRFPAAGQIVVDPSDNKHIVVRATYGLLSTSDGGASWAWICESSIGYGGSEDPMVGITQDSSILAGTFEGLSLSHDRGCQWDLQKGGLDGRYVIDLSVEKQDKKSSVLLISNSVSQNMFLTEVWQAPDNGKSWTVAGVDLPGDFLGLTLDTAPSDPSRIYVSGRYGAPAYQGALERSKDRGKTWESLPIPGADDTHLAYIGAIDPGNADVVYVRLDGDMQDSLKVSKDGGQTYMEVFTPKSLLGFALSPDGKMIAAGSDLDGLWIAPTDTLAFTQVNPSLHVGCLTWTADGLFACANEFKDGFTAGVSTDNGKTFTSIMHLQKLCGPLQCPASSSTAQQCPMLWGATALALGGATCDGDAGAGASSSSGASASASGSSGGTGSDGGCACSALGSKGGGAAAAMALLGATLLLGTRRKRR